MDMSVLLPVVSGYVDPGALIGFSVGLAINLIIGVIVGAIPAVCGIIKKRYGLGIGGFLACLGANFLCCALSVPVCIVFMLLIFLLPDSKNKGMQGNTIPVNDFQVHDTQENNAQENNSQE